MERHAWLVNVARGAHVVTDDLVAVLQAKSIGGAALDVTEPEPLPAGHPLWSLDNCLITPHTANTWEMAEPLFADRIRRNVERFAAGQPFLGLVNPAFGYRTDAVGLGWRRFHRSTAPRLLSRPSKLHHRCR